MGEVLVTQPGRLRPSSPVLSRKLATICRGSSGSRHHRQGRLPMSDPMSHLVTVGGLAGGAPAKSAQSKPAVNTTIRFIKTGREWNAPSVQQAWHGLLTETTHSDTLVSTPECSTQFGDLTSRGLLRSYLLWCGPPSCAMPLGFKSSGTWTYGDLVGLAGCVLDNSVNRNWLGVQWKPRVPSHSSPSA
jgi:hypothetical protein